MAKLARGCSCLSMDPPMLHSKKTFQNNIAMRQTCKAEFISSEAHFAQFRSRNNRHLGKRLDECHGDDKKVS